MPVKVVTLKNRVPTNCTSAASQSIRRGSHDSGRQRALGAPGGCPTVRSTLTASAYWR